MNKELNLNDITLLFTEIHNGNRFDASIQGRLCEKLSIENNPGMYDYDQRESFSYKLDDDNIIQEREYGFSRPSAKEQVLCQTIVGIKLIKTSKISKVNFDSLVDKVKAELKTAGIHIPTYEERMERNKKFAKIEQENQIKFEEERREIINKEFLTPRTYRTKKVPYYDPRDSY